MSDDINIIANNQRILMGELHGELTRLHYPLEVMLVVKDTSCLGSHLSPPQASCGNQLEAR